MPKVTICTPVLNMSEWLRGCIASVMAQTFADWEMIIVDDGSTEDIAAVVASFKDDRLSPDEIEQELSPMRLVEELRRLKRVTQALLDKGVISAEDLKKAAGD